MSATSRRAANTRHGWTWEIAALGDACKLTVVHDQFAEGEILTFTKVGGGWPFILSNLKSVLETGQPLQVTAA